MTDSNVLTMMGTVTHVLLKETRENSYWQHEQDGNIYVPFDYKYLLFEGVKGFILSSTDLIHRVYKKDELIDMGLERIRDDNKVPMMPDMYFEMSLDEVKKDFICKEVKDLKKQIDYFGIKQRIFRNYGILQRSCDEIGCRLEFPEWDWNY